MKYASIIQSLGICIFFIVVLTSCQIKSPTANIQTIVSDGKALQTYSTEKKWQQKDSFLISGDPFDELYAALYLQDGNFELTARLSLEKVDSSTALFLFFGHHFGFDSKPDEEDDGGRLFFYNPGTDELKKLEPALQYIQPGVPFDFKLYRQNGRLMFSIDNEPIAQFDSTEFVMPLEGHIAFRPGENVMRMYSWHIIGETRSLPALDFVFAGGEEGYVCFRIPAIIKTISGDLLAFAEARKDNCWSDGRDIDIVMKRSQDKGETWSPLQIIWDDGPNTCAYPTPVVEQSTGRITLLTCHNLDVDLVHDVINGKSQGRRRVFAMHSDDGNAWTIPKDITKDVMPDQWSWYGMGPGSGIQLEYGNKKGRLVIPAHHREFTTKKLFAHAIYSDDFGQTWELGQPTPTIGGNESQIVELQDGRLLMNMRNYNKTAPNQRQIAISHDEGASWEPSWFDSTLIEPPCQGSLIMARYQAAPQGLLLFANPPTTNKRADLTLRASLDEGQSWPFQKEIFKGATAYSDLVQLDDNTIGVLYERGHVFPYQGLSFEIVSLSEWLDL